ncbi:MAG: site-specific DNA-methyltransferase [Candidatus Lokiarchaeota archaeon]|nr:site-specific DNA-methyltransferase [Candidatus Lokiarchaeota archaeon]
MGKKKVSKTRSFGTPKRESHDSSLFYESKLYQNIPKSHVIKQIDNSKNIPIEYINTIIHGDSQSMDTLPDESIHFAVTSPPYNVRKEYDDNLGLTEYLELLRNVFLETWRVLVPGGRIAINIANIGRKPYIPLHTYVIHLMDEIGFLMRGEIIWDKSASAGISCAWGSFGSASNPVLRDVHEYIMVFSKQTMKRAKNDKKDSIRNEDFVQWSKSIWSFPTVSAKKIGHPAPFPVELPKRLIEFYTYQEDVILDPFIGSGSTAIAALETNRRFIGYEINQKYVTLANERIRKYFVEQQ